MENNDNYLNFLYKLIINKKIKEKNFLGHFLNSIKIKNSRIYKKIIPTHFAIVPIKLEDERYLLLKDLPLNFLISYGILIGDKSEIIQFKLKGKDQVYICEKSLYNYFKEDIDDFSIKTVNPSDLFMKKCIYEFDKSEILKELKNYLQNRRKLDLNKIHIISSNNIENFIPTIKTSHFKIAEKLGLPITSLIEKGFIKDSIISVNDYKSHLEIIKPIKILKDNMIWSFEKKTDEKLYKDISREIIIDFDTNSIIKKIINACCTNFKKDELIKQIIKIKNIEISSDIGNIPIPLWKAINTQKYVEIKDEEDFFEITGVKFELNEKKLEKIYIQTIKGEEAIYRDKYIKSEFEKTVFELEKSTNIIKFKTPKDLILKLLYNEKDPQTIIKIEEINKTQFLELKKLIKSIIKKTIVSSVKYNKLPYENIPQTIIEQYYSSVFNSLNLYYTDYEKYPSKKLLLKKTIEKSNFLLQTIKTQKIEEKELFFLAQISLILIKISSKFDPKLAKEFEDLFISYFKELKINLKKSRIDENIEKLVNQISIANKISKKYKSYLILKNEKIDIKLFSKKLEILNKRPKISKKIIKPNIRKIKEIFRYNAKQVEEQINSINYSNINRQTISIKGKTIALKQDFYTIYDEYENYKIKLQNEWFELLVNKS